VIDREPKGMDLAETITNFKSIVHMKSHKFCLLKHEPVSNSIIFKQIQLFYLLNYAVLRKAASY